MAGLNAEHMGGDGPTDVLSFPIDHPTEVPDDVPALLGDLLGGLAGAFLGVQDLRVDLGELRRDLRDPVRRHPAPARPELHRRDPFVLGRLLR